MDYTAVGQTTHLAARMEQLAVPGSIVLTAETLRLVEGCVHVEPLGPVPVKGLDSPVEIYTLDSPAPAPVELGVRKNGWGFRKMESADDTERPGSAGARAPEITGRGEDDDPDNDVHRYRPRRFSPGAGLAERSG